MPNLVMTACQVFHMQLKYSWTWKAYQMLPFPLETNRSLPYGTVSQHSTRWIHRQSNSVTRTMRVPINACAFGGNRKKHLWVCPDQNENGFPVTVPDFDWVCSGCRFWTQNNNFNVTFWKTVCLPEKNIQILAAKFSANFWTLSAPIEMMKCECLLPRTPVTMDRPLSLPSSRPQEKACCTTSFPFLTASLQLCQVQLLLNYLYLICSK